MSKISIFVLCISFCQIVFSQSLIKHFTTIPSDYVSELTVEERLKMINTLNDTSIKYGKFESRITELDTIANYIKINGDNMNSYGSGHESNYYFWNQKDTIIIALNHSNPVLPDCSDWSFFKFIEDSITEISILELVPQLKVASYDSLLDIKKIQEIDGGYYKTLQRRNKSGFDRYNLDISISKVNKELSIRHCWADIELTDKIWQNKTIIDKGAQTYHWSESSGTYRQ